jgi:hypothetical protein
MKSKLMTIAGAALFMLAMEFSASAATYDVSGGWFFDSFSGAVDVPGSSTAVGLVSPNPGPGIVLTLFGFPSTTVDLNDYVSSFKLGGLYGLTVNDGTGVIGDYTLSFDFTLPKNGHNGLLTFATLSEFECVPNRRGGGCKDENVVIAGLGLGDVTVDPTPLPPTLSLFGTGLILLGLFAWRRNRNNAAFGAAA